jgi:N-methylhydantoinase B/oxoprolinase/acetone carboxylase alpha subunit
VDLELFTCRFTSLVEEMGMLLQRCATSVNVKERLDFSCALLDADGQLVANAPHIPVHLGALDLCVRAVQNSIQMEAGDVIVTNHPACGGSHLPDITLIAPVHETSDDPPSICPLTSRRRATKTSHGKDSTCSDLGFRQDRPGPLRQGPRRGWH